MDIEVARINDKFQFKAGNGLAEIPIGAAPSMGDIEHGFRPMQLMLTALASCMSIDVLNILYKKRQTVDDYRVKVSATRTEGIPSIFKVITVEVHVKGEVKSTDFTKAIEMSRDTYCSVYKILKETATIEIKPILNEEEQPTL